jgi:hypothetical protein
MVMDVAPGQMRAKTLFGVEATYEVLTVGRGHALMQVVDVPGLTPGMRFSLTLDAVADMDVVDVRAEVEHGLASLLADAA